MSKVWGLYSSRVDPYNSWELIELFDNKEQAYFVHDMLFGKKAYPSVFAPEWHENKYEPEFSDLHVIEGRVV